VGGAVLALAFSVADTAIASTSTAELVTPPLISGDCSTDAYLILLPKASWPEAFLLCIQAKDLNQN
jgi:hypothetical protein